MSVLCRQSGCTKLAAAKFTWPGRDETAICAEHLPRLTATASALGPPRPSASDLTRGARARPPQLGGRMMTPRLRTICYRHDNFGFCPNCADETAKAETRDPSGVPARVDDGCEAADDDAKVGAP